jgi:hypothetical protein
MMTEGDIKLSDSRVHSGGGSKIKQSRLETLPPSSSSSQSKEDTAVVFSSQKSQFADYTTWKGIETKTGIEREDALSFLLKELLDNALDYLESTQHRDNGTAHILQQEPQIHVIVKKYQGKYIRIAVCNSNYARDDDYDDKSKAVFSKQTLKNIFDFDRYHSSKRNQFKITKGALGDALKEVLCIPHVLARDAGMLEEQECSSFPLYILSQQQHKLFQIELVTDRINQIIRSKINELGFDSAATADLVIVNSGDTEIILTVPMINFNDYSHEILKPFLDKIEDLDNQLQSYNNSSGCTEINDEFRGRDEFSE